MVRPLEKITADGHRYERAPTVEKAIETAMGQDLATLKSRAAVRDPKSPDYLPSECLLHLVRNARRGWNNDATSPPIVDALLPVLLKRCEAILNRHVSNTIDTAADLRQAILDSFVDIVVAEGTPGGSDALDFYEVRFNLAFRALRITHVNKELARINAQVTLPSHLDEKEMPEREMDDELLSRLSELAQPSASAEEILFRKRVFEAIAKLPSDERGALILVHYLGYDEESTDPSKETAATRCGVSGRTIRNRLKRAMEKLSKLKEDA